MDRINTIWKQLEKDSSGGSGLFKTLYSEEIAPKLYLGMLATERLRCFLLKVSTRDVRTVQADRNLKGLKLTKMVSQQDSSDIYLNLILLNQQAQEVFDILIQDIINKVSPLTEERHILRFFIERIETWRMLFDKTDSEILSAETQQGLYGELYFLRKWIQNNKDYMLPCVQAWLGIDNSLRDFQSSDWAVEVKTTKGNNHQKIQINSERQLDTSKLRNLWLFHISLEAQQQNGESLNQIIDSMFEILSDDSIALTEFKSKLLRAGYLAMHRPFYENTGYQIRQETFYIVRDNFPRIEESMIPRGVGDVKYSIIISDYADYIINESILFEIIRYGRD